ncbi:enoyl-CoA hydratase/isomerase family protein [Bradyrhizobium sp. 200]|uniref:enoyl-CoA hydratase/isomerase family protein n=1 Tax=Bradyrhizobium sp. 200 TaxID=2782665 RepID=UPI0020001255|nr:enoyl-CoA hydratase/isomerase family protein [Bradyrhizobium sp. 200]UPJ51553.1 enoyl-CoA hydratase/isomerase family protein [Bradyrhizobium sp. 200]
MAARDHAIATLTATELRAAINSGRALLSRLPRRSQRTQTQKKASEVIVHLTADAVWRFFRRHAVPMYRELTREGTQSLRVDALLWAAADRWPNILPTRAELAAESERMQADKDGLEIHQGLFISQIMANAQTGHHLIRSMLRPRVESLALLPEFIAAGYVDLGTAHVELRGEAGHVTICNEKYLNSEDDTVVGPLEIATDLTLLHPEVKIGVLRGSAVSHPKYQGQRVFSSGINLTRIYQGKQSYLSFLFRSMGLHNKLYRGVLVDDEPDRLDTPIEEPERTLEKLWIAAVDKFAIGGGCQLLLVVDYVIAEAGSYFNLPARKEGFLPGAANLRLSRFVGERLAREAILFDRKFYADTPEGRLIANEVVPTDEMDLAVSRCIARAVGSGMVSPGANRKAIRQQTEPLEAFRNYLTTYAFEQAFLHLSDQLIVNLERDWNARQRKL